MTAKWAIAQCRRLECLCAINALAAVAFGLEVREFRVVLAECDLPVTELQHDTRNLNLVGFWRVDKGKPPEQRLTVLSLVAFHDLQEKIDANGGDVERGIEAFCTQNDGEGWMLPETLRLADYGLGHDDRAQHPQPVRECFGPRFYDWQLAQSPEESWRECHLHARNLLGEAGYQHLLAEIEGCEEDGEDADQPDKKPQAPEGIPPDAADTPLFGSGGPKTPTSDGFRQQRHRNREE